MKKILKYIKYLIITLVSILLIFILSIGVTNHELKGTWIGEYEVHPEMDLYLAQERVMTLGYFSCFEEVPSYHRYFKFRQSKYHDFKKNRISFEHV